MNLQHLFTFLFEIYFLILDVSYEMYPMCHIGMKKTLWRKIMGIEEGYYDLNGESVMRKVTEVLGNSYLKGDSAWFADQKIISILIKRHADLYEIEKINYVGKRLDRSLNDNEWKSLLNNYYDSITDAHTFKNNLFAKWHLIDDLFSRMFKSDLNELLNKYYVEFSKI